MRNINDIIASLRPMTTADLALTLAWRNHPSVRSYMFTQHEISMREHQEWFASIKDNPCKRALVFEAGGVPCGFVNFNISKYGRVAEWGFYIAPTSPRGTGTLLGEAAVEYAFLTERLHKLCGQVLAYNERSIRFHERLGFRREGVLREHHFDGQTYHAVICFGLLAREWRSLSQG
jgi:pseudaminic acid biosynthesis N-acetyl transferase